MPHDRFYLDSNGKISEQAVVNISYDKEKKEVLEESRVPVNDDLSKLCIQLFESMPTLDHISINKKLKQEGFFKRLQDILYSMRYKEQISNNIFAPTVAINMMKHIQEYIPSHTMIMSDFDSFLMPRGSIMGNNAPLITNKLKDPT